MITRNLGLTLAALATLGAAVPAVAQTTPGSVTNVNVLTGTTVNVSSTFSAPQFAAANVVDGTNAQFVFADTDTTPTMTISSIKSTLNTLRFFDVPNFTGRTPGSVGISTSLNGTTFNALGNFLLPTDATSTSYLTPSTDVAPGGNAISYDTLSNLAIPVGTTALRFVFPQFTDTTGFTASPGVSEIQGFNVRATPAVPETSSFALLGLGLLPVALLARRRAAK